MAKREWRLQIQREAVHRLGPLSRLYSKYQVYVDGEAVPELRGCLCENGVVGDSAQLSHSRPLAEGAYPIWTQFGRYSSTGYGRSSAENLETMPGLRVRGTGRRKDIVIRPGHDPDLYQAGPQGLTPTKSLRSDELMDFSDSRHRTIALIESLREFYSPAFDLEVTQRIREAIVSISGEPRDVRTRSGAGPTALSKASPQPSSLPISKNAAVRCAEWLIENFGDKLRAAVIGKQYRVKHLCAIVCQETAYKWLNWVNDLSPEEIVERCVFDASGDVAGAPRSAFPKNTAAFRTKYDRDFCDMLVEEANQTRRLQQLADREWIYKGYGIFQYDLQHVVTDEQFFRNREWRSFDTCLRKCCDELDDKLASSAGDLWKAIRMYNGSGAAAEQYRENVRAFSAYCETVTGV